MMRTILAVTTACILAAGAVSAADEPAAAVPTLARLAVCTSVQDRAPVGEAESFPADVGRLWCFTWVENVRPPLQIYHRWYVGERLINEIPITVKGSRWRCWSRKSIRPGWSGPCRVEVVTEEGDVLGTKEFTLTAPPSREGADPAGSDG